MKTKTLENKKVEKNDLETNHFISIPEEIKKEINNKWFYVYNWIWNQDVKHSIQRDFLKTIWSTAIQVLSAIFIFISAIIWYSSWTIISLFFLWGLAITIILFIIYLSFLSIKRSNDLRKNWYVVLTNTHSSINWNIVKLTDNKVILDKKQNKISDLYEEKLFWKSWLKESKKSLFKDIVSTLWVWFKKILSIWSGRNSKNSGQIIIILLALYLLYILSIWIIYLIWIFFVWIFSIFISIINKKILLASWHEVTIIQNHFEEIDNSSRNLIKQKTHLSWLLNEAMKNDWRDSLLIKINKDLENINKSAEISIKESLSLKDEIKTSKYNEIFDFSIYNSWIKKEVKTPLIEIRELLELNLNKLKSNLIDIDKKLENTSDPSMSWPLQASKTRTNMRIEEISKHISAMNLYIDKLK